MSSVATLQDSLSPEALAEIAQSFGLELQASDYRTDGDLVYDEIERMVGFTTGEYLWDAMWRFAIIVDDDLSYYIPDDYDTVVELITLDAIEDSEEAQ